AALAAPAPPAALAPSRPSDPVSRHAEAGRELLAEPGQRYAVQLLVSDARERAYLEAALAEATRTVNAERIFLVPAGTRESPRFAMVYGAFADRAEASAALAALPANLRQFAPYVRTLEALRDEARNQAR